MRFKAKYSQKRGGWRGERPPVWVAQAPPKLLPNEQKPCYSMSKLLPKVAQYPHFSTTSQLLKVHEGMNMLTPPPIFQTFLRPCCLPTNPGKLQTEQSNQYKNIFSPHRTLCSKLSCSSSGRWGDRGRAGWGRFVTPGQQLSALGGLWWWTWSFQARPYEGMHNTAHSQQA